MATGGEEQLDQLTAAEEQELRQMRIAIHDGTEDLDANQLKRLIALQNKEFKSKQQAAESNLARAEAENARLAEELDTTSAAQRARRRLAFEDDEENFDPPWTSSRLRGRHMRRSAEGDTVAKLADLTMDDIDSMPAPDAKKLLKSLPNDATTNAIRLAAKVMSNSSDTKKTMKRSNDFVHPPTTDETKTDIDPKTDKHIKLIMGNDTRYSSPTDHTLTMRELLTRHSEATSKFDLDTTTSLRVLKTFAGGFLRQTLERFEREKYSLAQCYTILQTSYQDSPTIGEARRSLEALMARADQFTNIYLLVTNLIQISYDIFQLSPSAVRQAEAITNTTNHLFMYLFKTYQRRGVAQLQDLFNVFRDSQGTTLTEHELWPFIARVEYFCAYEGVPIKNGEQHLAKPNTAGHGGQLGRFPTTARVNNVEERRLEETCWGPLNHLPEGTENEDKEGSQHVQDVQYHQSGPAHHNPAHYTNNDQLTRFQTPYQHEQYQGNMLATKIQAYGPRPTFTPQVNHMAYQRPAGPDRTETMNLARQRLSANPRDYPKDITCRLCSGSSSTHSPPYYRFCTVFPRELPTGRSCPQCQGQHRIAPDGICRNPLLPQLSKMQVQSVSEEFKNHEPHYNHHASEEERQVGFDTTFHYLEYEQ